MILREYFENYLQTRGMCPKEAALVMDILVADKIFKEVKWESAKEDYSEGLLAVLMVTVNQFALDWIKENKPEAWYRPVFE